MKQVHHLISLSLLIIVVCLTTIKARPFEDVNETRFKRQIASDFGESLQSSIDAQNSAIQSSISAQGISLSNSIKSVTESRSTVPITQASDGTCTGISVNGRCCVGSFINNVCYSPDAKQSEGNSSTASTSQTSQSSGATPTPTSTSATASPSANSNRNNGAFINSSPTEMLSIILFTLNLFFWM